MKKDYFVRASAASYDFYGLGKRYNADAYWKRWVQHYHGEHHRTATIIKRATRRKDKETIKNLMVSDYADFI